MPVKNITFVQVFRVERQITIPVETTDIETTLEFLDAPPFDDAAWKEEWDLQNADTYEAKE